MSPRSIDRVTDAARAASASRAAPLARGHRDGSAERRRPLVIPARPRVALHVKRSLYRAFVEEQRDRRMTELLIRGDATVARLRAAHDAHERGTTAVREALERAGATVELLEGLGNASLTRADADLVVSIGGDGTLLRASHQVVDVPVLGVNSAPEHSVGFFCRVHAEGFADALRRAQSGRIAHATLARMQVRIADRVVSERVLNDALFCHASPAATSRYLLELGDISEEHKSSGFWIGPAAGSTAAQCSAGGRVLPLESTRLQLVVREPYTPKGEHYRLRHALIDAGRELIVRTKIRDATLFLDGPDRLFRAKFGDVIGFRVADVPLVLLGLGARRRW